MVEDDHPPEVQLVDWADGKLHGTAQHGDVARHLMVCQRCAGLLLGQAGPNADAAYELLRTSWRELVETDGPERWKAEAAIFKQMSG